MSRVDIKDESSNRYSVWHQRFDIETNHFRWFLIDCFDRKREMNSLLQELLRDLESRERNGEAHPKEQYVGRIRKSSKFRFRFLSR